MIHHLKSGLCLALVALLAGSLSSCTRAKEGAEETTRTLTGADAIQKGRDIQEQLQQLGAERDRDLKELE